jgi:hypothetical protein
VECGGARKGRIQTGVKVGPHQNKESGVFSSSCIFFLIPPDQLLCACVASATRHSSLPECAPQSFIPLGCGSRACNHDPRCFVHLDVPKFNHCGDRSLQIFASNRKSVKALCRTSLEEFKTINARERAVWRRLMCCSCNANDATMRTRENSKMYCVQRSGREKADHPIDGQMYDAERDSSAPASTGAW